MGIGAFICNLDMDLKNSTVYLTAISPRQPKLLFTEEYRNKSSESEKVKNALFPLGFVRPVGRCLGILPWDCLPTLILSSDGGLIHRSLEDGIVKESSCQIVTPLNSIRLGFEGANGFLSSQCFAIVTDHS
jgi:hypothetical protein